MAIEDEIRELKEEVTELRGTNDSLRMTVAVQTQELDALRIEAIMLRSSAKRESLKSESMKTMMTTMSAMLLQGLNRMEVRDREERMRAQEERLGVGDEDMSPVGPGFRQRMDVADKPTPARVTPDEYVMSAAAVRKYTVPLPTKRGMHFEGKAPSFEFAGAHGDVVYDLDSPNVWEMVDNRWTHAGMRPAGVGPALEAVSARPRATHTPAYSAPPAPPLATPAPLPRKALEPAPERPRPGTPRNDIVDSRLPPVTMTPADEDHRDLAALAQAQGLIR